MLSCRWHRHLWVASAGSAAVLASLCRPVLLLRPSKHSAGVKDGKTQVLFHQVGHEPSSIRWDTSPCPSGGTPALVHQVGHQPSSIRWDTSPRSSGGTRALLFSSGWTSAPVGRVRLRPSSGTGSCESCLVCAGQTPGAVTLPQTGSLERHFVHWPDRQLLLCAVRGKGERTYSGAVSKRRWISALIPNSPCTVSVAVPNSPCKVPVAVPNSPCRVCGRP